ncbi:MAG: helix-turn-helix domain-containing protein [Terriglobia bacterium]
MASYPWPGNVRELENVVERAVVLSQTEEMGLDLLPPELSQAIGPPTGLPTGADSVSLFELTDEYERRLILDTLTRCNGSQTEAAQHLQVPLSTLNQKIKRLGIEFRRPVARVGNRQTRT